MNNFVDKIMSNHVFNSESSEDLYYLYSDEDLNDISNDKSKKLKGGSNDINTSDVPNGGFPPIFIIDPKDKETDINKNRELNPVKSSSVISIKDILKSKK